MASVYEQAINASKRANWGKRKAKQFPSGRRTATETGAKQEAARNYREVSATENAKEVMGAARDTQSFEDYIQGKKR